MTPTVLILPGFGNSGPKHWQTLWEQAHSDFRRVEQKDWNNPICEEWVASLELALENANLDVILVAHSMACLVVAHWANKPHTRIKGALLVAVPNTKRETFPKVALGFDETPMTTFDFPSIVVASTNDEYASLNYAASLAKSWGSEFVDVGAKGHINATSGLGEWEEGFALLEKLRKG